MDTTQLPLVSGMKHRAVRPLQLVLKPVGQRVRALRKFYGFVGAEDNMWEPTIHDGVTVVDAPQKEGYHFTEDMTDQAIGWMRQQKAIKPDKPFFIYYSSAGSHSPTM